VSSIEARAARIKLVLFDVDGVLTDGRVLLHGDGTESKAFFIRDGIAMVWAQRMDLKIGLLSARSSPSTNQRAAQLGITLVYQVPNKLATYETILREVGVSDEEVAYMGDDILDLGVLVRVGLSTAPADAVREVRERVHWVAPSRGGQGAARELVELIFRAQGRWDSLVASFTAAPQDA
jgi:3-deoxy-D-manno-octulosonate 8-phosphate phosphatase (KDO 8-P phosphatase)